ncbi:hypothetical protein D0Y65_054213 [Glycine soja]|uniref:Uncharacterized protein n=1 Tax=Glycine soja TaxID=3848 RepID=A0A445F5N7_GLYSO|nr:hypothetical protein D0Y65_054213 [Glycine soja]
MTKKSTRKRKMGDTEETAPKKPAAKWPLIKPKKNLQISHLLDFDLFSVINPSSSFGFQFFNSILIAFFMVQNLFSSAESKAFVKIAEEIGFAHQGSRGGEAYRDNDRISVDDPVLADTIWESGLGKLFSDIKIRGKVAVGLNPNVRFYRFVSLYTRFT